MTPPRTTSAVLGSQFLPGACVSTLGEEVVSREGMTRMIWYVVPSLTKEQMVHEAKTSEPSSSDDCTQLKRVHGHRKLTKPCAAVGSKAHFAPAGIRRPSPMVPFSL